MSRRPDGPALLTIMAKHKIIQPRLTTPLPGSADRIGSSRIPDTLLSEQLQRLTICTAVGAGLWAFGLVMDTIVRPLTITQGIQMTTVTIEIAAIALSGLMFLYTRYAPQ